MSPARVLFSTGSLYNYDTSACFALAAEAGYDGMEVMCDDRWTTREPSYLRDLSAQYGLPVQVVHTPFSPRVSGWKINGELDRIIKTLRLAEAVGSEAIVVHLPAKVGYRRISIGGKIFPIPWGKSPFDEVKTWIKSDLPAIQKSTRVKIAIENMPGVEVFGRQIDGVWWNQPDEWGQIHDWLTLDTTHWATKKINPLDAYWAANGRVQHVHLSNYENRREHRLPSKGDLDLGGFLQALAADQFSGTISLELTPDALDFADMSRVREHMGDELAFCRTALKL